jgi:hypothetical protein
MLRMEMSSGLFRYKIKKKTINIAKNKIVNIQYLLGVDIGFVGSRYVVVQRFV